MWIYILNSKIWILFYFEKVSSPGNLFLFNIEAFNGSDCVESSNKFELIKISDSEILSKINSSDFWMRMIIKLDSTVVSQGSKVHF